MFLHVERELIIERELLLAEVAFEGLVPGVLPVVSRQPVRTEKLPTAPFPCALIRLLPRVGPFVLIQVRTPYVLLVTAGKVTEMHLPLFWFLVYLLMMLQVKHV